MNKKRFVVALTILVFMPVVAVVVLSLTNTFYVKDLQTYGEVPAFTLTERSGKEVDSKGELAGKVWVASFVFTHCAGQCPLLCEKLKTVQNKLRFKDKFRLISITMDPERDTPPVLAEYAQRFDADPYKWLFLTGAKKKIDFLVHHGFRLTSGDPLTHSFKLVLVDGNNRIRGYYDGLEDDSVKQLIRDAKHLIRKTF